jgi:hypothetical protein
MLPAGQKDLYPVHLPNDSMYHLVDERHIKETECSMAFFANVAV